MKAYFTYNVLYPSFIDPVMDLHCTSQMVLPKLFVSPNYMYLELGRIRNIVHIHVFTIKEGVHAVVGAMCPRSKIDSAIRKKIAVYIGAEWLFAKMTVVCLGGSCYRLIKCQELTVRMAREDRLLARCALVWLFLLNAYICQQYVQFMYTNHILTLYIEWTKKLTDNDTIGCKLA